MKCLLVSILCLAAQCLYVLADDKAWAEFLKTYNKSYDTPEEEKLRKNYFIQALKSIEHCLERELRGEITFKCGVNFYADWSFEEYNVMNGYNSSVLEDIPEMTFRKRRGLDVLSGFNSSGLEDLPEMTSRKRRVLRAPSSLDWRAKGAVTPVKQQGACGSCWAFSTTGAMEAQHYIKHKRLISMSEQNLVDCCHNGNFGCSGGWPESAMKEIQRLRGIASEATYPYEGVNGNCRYTAAKKVSTCNGVLGKVGSGEPGLIKALAYGTVSCAVDAGKASFQYYNGGVYNEPSCGQAVNHAILVVGYGTYSNGQPYWLVKNSWGTGWGVGGYMYLARNSNNKCGIASSCVMPKVP